MGSVWHPFRTTSCRWRGASRPPVPPYLPASSPDRSAHTARLCCSAAQCPHATHPKQEPAPTHKYTVLYKKLQKGGTDKNKEKEQTN